MRQLIEEALEARKESYSPYSGFRVGAALESASGKIYRGCNIENAAYTPTNCAERTAFFAAISQGERDFRRIAIVGGKEGQMCRPNPCGVCLQVMAEFCDPETFEVVLAMGPEDYQVRKLGELLPYGFTKEVLS